jgi:hypothetical protein
MKTLVGNGKDSLAGALEPLLTEFSEMMTAIQTNFDSDADLSNLVRKINFPKRFDAVTNKPFIGSFLRIPLTIMVCNARRIGVSRYHFCNILGRKFSSYGLQPHVSATVVPVDAIM